MVEEDKLGSRGAMATPISRLVFVLSLLLSQGRGRRVFLPLPRTLQPPSDTAVPNGGWPIVRVQQFNVLADGLAGLRPDLGKFGRADKSVLEWDERKGKLLAEMVEYDADVITVQEMDHFHDFFQPQLNARGYSGYFAPKPTSACLEVSDKRDGCALFVKRSRLRVLSCETKTLALSITKLSEGELQEESVGTNLRAQNQIGIIAVLEFVSNSTTTRHAAPSPSSAAAEAAVEAASASAANSNSRWYYPEGSVGDGNSLPPPRLPPPLLVSTVHLKSAKTATGERYRQKGILQVLNDLTRISTVLSRMGRPPAVILTGDFNAVPDFASGGGSKSAGALQFSPTGSGEYAPITYRAVKMHSMGLRSVYNDDLPTSLSPSASSELYTTWKARTLLSVRDGQTLEARESVVKRCIDYIFYMPFRRGPYRSFSEAVATPVVASNSVQVVLSLLLRTAVYLFGVVIPSTAIINSGLEATEKLQVVVMSALGLVVFELTSEGSIFRPAIKEVEVIEGIDYEAAVRPGYREQYLNSAGRVISTGADRGKELVKTVKTISKKLQTPSQYGNPGLQAVAVLDLPSDKDVGSKLLPNENFPSDHLSLIADLELLW